MRGKVAGAGSDLVLLHGWGMNADVWDEVATTLARQFRVHSVELPAASSAPNALQAMVDTIAAPSAPRATWRGDCVNALQRRSSVTLRRSPVACGY